LIPYSIKNHILESPSPWVTIDIYGYKILNLKVSFPFWID